MPDQTFGLSFVPGAPQGPTAQGPGQIGGPPPSPVQTAIRMLSLRLPHVVGAQGLAPSGLLQGPGAQAFGGQAGGLGGLEEFLRLLFGMGPGAPGPRVIPGLQPGAHPTPPTTQPPQQAFGLPPGPYPSPYPPGRPWMPEAQNLPAFHPSGPPFPEAQGVPPLSPPPGQPRMTPGTWPGQY